MRSSALLLLSSLLLVPALSFASAADDPPAIPAPPAGDAIYFSKEAQFLLKVRTEPAAMRELEVRISVPGKVVPRTDRRAQIFAPFTGRIVAGAGRIPLVGERVKKGQVLAAVEQSVSAPENTQLISERIKAESEVVKAEGVLAQAKRDLARLESLSGVVAEKEVQRAELAVRNATQELERARRERALYDGTHAGKEGRLTRFPLIAPLDGVLVEARATLGEQVDPSRAVFTVLDSSVVWIEANVFANDVARVEEAKEAQIRSEAYPDVVFPAALFNLGQTVDETTRTVKVTFEAANPDGRLRPGTFVEVAIGAGRRERTLVIPEEATVEIDGKRFVYVHGAPEEFVAREVTLGTRDGDRVAVRSGLREGDRVVVSGAWQLRSAQQKR